MDSNLDPSEGGRHYLRKPSILQLIEDSLSGDEEDASTGDRIWREKRDWNDDAFNHRIIDGRARLDQDAWNLTPSQSATTSYAPSMANSSSSFYPTKPSAPSVAQEDDGDNKSGISKYTYYSDLDAEKFIRKIEGRAYNALNETYFLPADEDEWTRLNKQHLAFMVALGELYPEPGVVRALLAPSPSGGRKRILDLGSGTGVWATTMSRNFPDADVVGIDLAPVPLDLESVPSNCRFEIDDINLGLEHFKDSFDLVHARLIGSGLKDFRKTLRDVHACLRPGGMIIWVDVDYDMYTGEEPTYARFALDEDELNPTQNQRSWTQRVIYEMRRGAVGTGRSDLFTMATALDEGLWDDALLDPDTCRTASLYLPLGPWLQGATDGQTQRLKYVGSLIRQDMVGVQRASQAVMKKLGWDPKRVEKWCKFAEDELMAMDPKMWVRIRYAWGRRRAANGSAPSLPPSPKHSPGSESEAGSISAWPYYFVYTTREEAIKEMQVRNEGKDITPPPSPAARKPSAVAPGIDTK
ncbi:SubName: Full=Uncharacterized protein {ECO:0000313/EMBL:CCA67102.1} [Serendipita indica DSM 11827]|uniref:Methyltransferase domain-containing protein n=1 Tax=Serendipita indica (strain DSM 11827) TaxID=1109443 RepID=G4T718_SERID|nr:SubName: Full=Uncharacterized protein {ECO:0000313/EMBL:CCA67102.1} [Serendipita indica DSM 11827]CCA67102.1 hypothetical protein PIIN_00936 [Serendipita indica DSM 11827]